VLKELMLGLKAALYTYEVCGTVSLCVATIHILDPSPIEMKSNFRRGFEGVGEGEGVGDLNLSATLRAPVPLLLLNSENSSNASVCILQI
jgi:hypothetical protein